MDSCETEDATAVVVEGVEEEELQVGALRHGPGVGGEGGVEAGGVERLAEPGPVQRVLLLHSQLGPN